MRRVGWTIIVTLMVCALMFVAYTATAIAKPAGHTLDHPRRHCTDRPFNGFLCGEVTFNNGSGLGLPPNPNPPYIYAISSAVGNVSYLGRTMMTSYHPTPGLDPTHYGPGYMTLVSANGDEVSLTYTGYLPFNPSAPPGTWFKGPASFTITGGTGRFADAEGAGVMTLRLRYPGSLTDPNPWRATWTWDARISY